MKSLRQSLHKQDLLGLGIMVILFVVFYFLFDEEILDDYWETNVILILINIIMAVSLNLINGLTGQFSIGHAGFMAVGAYTSAIITVKLGMDFPIALIVATVSAAFLGFLIGMPTLRLNGDYLAIATLGLGEIIRIAILNIDYVGGASGFMGIPRLTTFPIAFWIMVFVVYFIKSFKNSADGRACLAIRENEIAAETMGINTTKYKVMAFTIGAGFAGTPVPVFPLLLHCPPGFLYLHASFDVLTMVVLGGLGSISGSISGAVLLTAISAALADYPEWRMVIYSIVLIVLMLNRPQGSLATRN